MSTSTLKIVKKKNIRPVDCQHITRWLRHSTQTRRLLNISPLSPSLSPSLPPSLPLPLSLSLYILSPHSFSPLFNGVTVFAKCGYAKFDTNTFFSIK